ncbi:phage terminase small subunit P27 family [Nocardioides sp. R-C-SC26]|uniref:phage terminase small subunit P27 family n=1 Tax=Nocardioides sp. R-C-SC26 TaxID=2870414 RepID=UPI001E60EC34|nr:phage terminase small subunit P27 family [Nocardioides sp. R-C-SC26]
MGSGGHNRKPHLAAVREGNPGKRSLKDSVVMPPSELREPSWTSMLDRAEADRARALWRKLAPSLSRSVGLVGEQQETLVDFCVTWARIVQNEKALTKEGMLIEGAKGGLVKNPRTTVLNQYRSHFRSLVGELGLSPRAAAGLSRPDGPDDDDPFDD